MTTQPDGALLLFVGGFIKAKRQICERQTGVSGGIAIREARVGDEEVGCLLSAFRLK